MKSLSLADPVELRLDSTDDGDVRVQLANEENGNVYYSVVRANDFYTSAQKRGEVTNKAIENLPESYNGEKVREELQSVLSWCDANHEDVKRATRPEGVENILSATQKVEAIRGEQTEFEVTVEHEGHSAELTFTAGEWASNSPHPLIEQWTAAFLSRPNGITADRWEEVRKEWEDQLEHITDTGATPAELTAEAVVNGVRKTGLPAVTQKKHLRNDETATLYDEGASKISRPEIDSDKRVLWVRSGLLRKKLKDEGESPDFMSQLSVTLQKSGELLGASSRHRLGGNGTKYSLYPFDADKLGVDPGMDVVERGDNPDEEVEP